MSIWAIWVLATGLLAATAGGGVLLGRRRSAVGRHRAERAATRRAARFAARRADWRARIRSIMGDDPPAGAGWSK